MNIRDAFPSTPDELACMSVCYALTAVLCCMVVAPHRVFGFVMGLLP